MSHDRSVLTAEQRARYHDEGYLVLPDLVPAESLASLRRATLEIIDGYDLGSHRSIFSTRDRDAGRDELFFASAQGVECFLEPDALGDDGELLTEPRLAINKIGHALHDLVPAFTELCRRPIFGQLLRDIGLAQPLLWQTMVILKPPRIGGEVRWHQDASYLATEPAGVVGMWLAIDDAHRDNGCLWVQPGGHRSPLRDRYEVDWAEREGTLRSLDSTPWPTPAQTVPLEVRAGSLVLFHDHLPHGSEANRSERSRQAFTMHVADRSAAWSPRNWLQRPQLGDFPL